MMLRILLILSIAMTFAMCQSSTERSTGSQTDETNESDDKVRIMTLDPGHFHAALIQKSMYEDVDPIVHVFAPPGEDLQAHLARIEGFNTRETNPTSWDLQIYAGPGFFEKMIAEKPGNLMNISGNNQKKTEYIKATVDAGIHVLADKPMAINAEGFALLEEAFQVAEENGVLLYDIMTERYEITTIIQRELSQMPEVFGELLPGTPEEPAITKESVHHFYKYVSGSPLTRPAWFFDVEQQGDGMVDVGTHLVDLIQWEAFPEVILAKEDIEITSSRRWATELSREMFERVTKLSEFPDYLQKYVEDNVLKVYSNGEINYQLKGINAKISVIWNYQAPEGAADTHYSIMRGSKSDLIIEQGEKEGYKPQLYIESGSDVSGALATAIEALSDRYPGLAVQQLADDRWSLLIPDKYKVGHEAHFAQVTAKYLEYLKQGKLPDWEVPNMIVKYHTTTSGLAVAQ
ncbi:MAG: putative oxidoreductase C-terminal domain-containing protein [Bacteroidota bacterium]